MIRHNRQEIVKYEKAYWLKHAEKIKEVIGDVPLILEFRLVFIKRKQTTADSCKDHLQLHLLLLVLSLH